MRMFEADTTASARLIKVAFIKLYNRLQVQRAVPLVKQSRSTTLEHQKHTILRDPQLDYFKSLRAIDNMKDIVDHTKPTA